LGSALVFERWQSSSLFFFNCPLFNYSFQLKKIKCCTWGKTSADSVGKNHWSVGRALGGRDKKVSEAFRFLFWIGVFI